MTLAQYHLARERGLCVRCMQPADGYACESCKVVLRAAERTKRAKLRALGLCRLCKGPALAGKAECAGCAEAEAERKSAAYRMRRDTRPDTSGATPLRVTTA